MNASKLFFKYRGYTPVPFVIAMLIFGNSTPLSLVAGFILACLGEALRAWGVLYVGAETRVTGNVGASRLVTAGPFSRTRNPLYLGNILIYLGVGVMSLALFPWLQLAALGFFALQYYLIVKEEERFLLDNFGDEYRRYCESVPRFMFRLRPWSGASDRKPDWRAGRQSEARTLQAFALITAAIFAIWLLK